MDFLNRRLSKTLLLTLFAHCAASALQGDDHGIGVGAPKAFDNRTLTIMLEQLNERLRHLDFIKQEAVDKAFGLIQTYRSEDTTQAFIATGGTTPKITRDTEANDTTGTLSAKEKRETSERSPQIPWLMDLQTPPAYNGQYGVGPGDLLSQQVELSYQVFNLRMLLERSLNDRMWGAEPRLQTVLGFNVTLTPPRHAKDAAAVVEISVRPDTGGRRLPRRGRNHDDPPLSIAAVMPQERTYNAAALSQKSNAFGGAAVARLFTVGYSQRRRGTNFFVYRDSDTVAFEMPQEAESDSVRFGWEFRPVLGRRSVSPGPRQMFAVLSLPQRDDASARRPVPLIVTVRTWWRHFDPKTLTTSESKGWFQRKRLPEASPREYPLRVFPTNLVQARLKPHVERVDWMPTSIDTGVLTVTGKNFYTGTTVRIGDKVLGTPQDGLLIKSEHLLQVHIPVGSLGHEAVLVGRYGESIRLEKNSTEFAGVQINGVSTRSLGKQTEIRVRLSSSPPTPLTPDQRARLSFPALIVGDKALNGPYNLQWANTASGVCGTRFQCFDVLAIVSMAEDDVQKSSFRIVYPFWGRSFAKAPRLETTLTSITVARLFDSPMPEKDAPSTPPTKLVAAKGNRMQKLKATAVAPAVSTVSSSRRVTFLLSAGMEQFDKNWEFHVSGNAPAKDVRFLSPNADGLSRSVLVTVAENEIASKKILIVSPVDGPRAFDLPDAKPEPRKPALPNPAVASVNQNESVSVKYVGGVNLDLVSRASFEGITLRAQAEDSNTSVRVYLTRAVTSKPGRMEVTLESADGKEVIRVPVFVNPVPGADKASD